MMQHDHGSPDMRECIRDCLNCHSVCLRTATQICLQEGGRHTEPEHMKLMLDCSEICQTAANFMLRGSVQHAQVCAVCAYACEVCAASCEQIGGMEECVEACRRCADSCQRMAASEMGDWRERQAALERSAKRH